jgi:hypothetical protein
MARPSVVSLTFLRPEQNPAFSHPIGREAPKNETPDYTRLPGK